MRKLSLLAGVVGASLVLSTAALADTNEQEFSAGLTPAKKGSKKKPRSAQLSISLITNTKDDAGNDIKPAQATLAEFSFPKGMKLNTGLIKKKCTKSALEKKKSASACHGDTKIGSGSVYLDATPILSEDAKGTVTLFSGGKGKVLLLISVKQPIPSTVVLEGSLKRASGSAFGDKLSVKVPVVEALGTSIVIPRIELKVKKTISYKKGKKKIKTGVIETPTTCKGTWLFSETTTFADGSKSTVEDEVSCK